MIVRVRLVLEQEEYSALSKLALSQMRSPEEQLRFMVTQHLKRLGLLSEEKDIARKSCSEVSGK